MTDKLHFDAGLPVKFFFEGKDDQHLVDELSDLLDAARTPCPNLRADVVNDRRARLLQSFCEPKVEIGKVNEDGGGRGIRFDAFGNAAENAIKRSKMADDFKGADDGGLADVSLQLNARLAHFRSSQAVDAAAWKFLEKAACHFGAVHVA